MNKLMNFIAAICLIIFAWEMGLLFFSSVSDGINNNDIFNLFGIGFVILLLFSGISSDRSRQRRRGVPEECIGCWYITESRDHYSRQTSKLYRIAYSCSKTDCPKRKHGFYANRGDAEYYKTKHDTKPEGNRMNISNSINKSHQDSVGNTFMIDQKDIQNDSLPEIKEIESKPQEQISEMTQEQVELLRKLKTKVISFANIPDKFKDRCFCLEAVKINGHALKFVPLNIIDIQICIAAVENNKNAINHVPSKFRSEISNNIQISSSVKYNKTEDELTVKDMMEEYIPGKNKCYGISDYHSHDSGSLYDQLENIKDNLD